MRREIISHYHTEVDRLREQLRTRSSSSHSNTSSRSDHGLKDPLMSPTASIDEFRGSTSSRAERETLTSDQQQVMIQIQENDKEMVPLFLSYISSKNY